jgi:hypothetical protein
MTVENAIRLMAGTLVLVGLALGLRVHQYWFGLCAFVGLNLIQSAFTHFCPAEMIFKKAGLKPAGSCSK